MKNISESTFNLFEEEAGNSARYSNKTFFEEFFEFFVHNNY